MLLVILGVVLLVLRLAGYGPVEALPWWALAVPFAGAIAWWTYSDASGLTQRIAIARFEARRALRRRKMMKLLGLVITGHRPRAAASSAAPAASAPGTEAVTPSELPRPSGGAQTASGTEPKFEDTVPSQIDVPEDLAESRPDWRRID